ncbi:MAG: hypothetical protein WCH59_13195 [Chitinophagia bacterium]|jgi:hypothetical protein
MNSIDFNYLLSIKKWVWLLTLGLAQSAIGQYYYNDVIANYLTHQQYKLLRSQKVKKITGYSQESNQASAGDILFTQEISIDGKRITVFSMEQNSKSSRTTTYYNLGKLIKSESSNKNTLTTTTYTYHESGLPSQIQTITRDTFLASTTTEIHQYFFKKDSTLDFAYIIRNNSDTIHVFFTCNTQKQILDETWKRKNKEIEKYYFYYDAKNELTDIVRYNNIANKMLPDYIFTYADQGNIVEMIQVPRTGTNYLIWKYSYNEKGLKLADQCYNKSKVLMGNVNYVYEY